MGWVASPLPHRAVEVPLVDAAIVTPQTWGTLPLAAQLYVASVILAGSGALATSFPIAFPDPFLFSCLFVFACLTSAWKVNLPIPVANGSTLSVSYAANLMSLLLLGPQHAVLIAVAGALTQCTYRTRHADPLYRAVFSASAVVITMTAAGAVYGWLDGTRELSGLANPLDGTRGLSGLAKPLVGTIATYFLVNTGLIAGAIATSTSRTFIRTWQKDFLWSGASFMVAGSAGALSAVIVARGDHWQAILLVAPIYLTYRTYELFVGRLEDQKRHTNEIHRLHQETVEALGQAREAEHALAGEKERLAVTVAELTRIEEQRHLALEREQAARASSEQANRLKDQFLAVVSHELRTPLNAILGWADMLRRGAVSEANRHRAFQTIFDSAKRQAQLVDDMLDVSRIASGKLRVERAPVDLAAVSREAVHVVQPSADARGIRLSFDASQSTFRVLGDAARLQQVIWNLLSNAVKFTPEGGAVRVGLQTTPEGDAVEVHVTDTGAGISKEFLPSVFEAFRQADSSATRMHPGLGLGLSIVKSLVEAHRGTVQAFSDGEGLGATFIVRLPAANGSPSTIAATEDGAMRPDALASLEGLSILVVDDDVESREVVAAQLEDRHANVLMAGSAAQALDVLRWQHVDVLLADIGMPDEDGYSLIRKVRQSLRPEAASVAAAALTAFAREEDRRQSFEAGFQMHLTKPVEVRELVAAVAALGKLAPIRSGA